MKLHAIFLSAALLFASSFASSQTFEVTQIQATAFQQSISRGGKVAFKRTYNLAFKSSGYLAQLLVDEGDVFKENQLLASLDSIELKSTKRSSYAQLMQAERNVTRLTNLVEQMLSSDIDLENARTQLITARSAYQVASYQLEKAELKSPFAGVVLARYSDQGELQTPNQALLKVADQQQNLIVKLGLTEQEIGLVQLGQKVDIHILTLGSRVGEITKIPALPQPNNSLYVIEIELINTPMGKGIIAGQLAKVTVNLHSDELVYQVPINGLIKMLANGQAILLSQQFDQQKPSQTAFDVKAVNRHSIYLRANSNKPKSFVIDGWQLDAVGK
jgi:RND family efflux transporter MFP subunit